MATASSRPRLRPIETVVVPDRRLGKALLLRDTQGVTSKQVLLPMALVPIVARFTGRLTCEQIAREASAELGEEVPGEVVVRIATDLEDALFAFGAPFDRARAKIEREFADADVRPASHAGGAYYGERDKLAEYIEQSCFGAAKGRDSGDGRRLVGLVAPHIDPWRGARCYGEAYGVLAKAIPAAARTFVLFGTSHAPMREPFALCRKAFDTPLGPVSANLAAVDAIARACPFDPYADQLNHKREHSLEFQVVFLKHLMKGRPFTIVPILAGLGEEQSSGRDPAKSPGVERFLDAVRKVVSDEDAVVVAGADLAHVGPRFGDPKPLDEEERAKLAETDQASLSLAASRDHAAFWEHVARDLDTRRVCGLAPIYALLRTLSSGAATGAVGHYEQNVDPDEGSIVSHAAVGFFA